MLGKHPPGVRFQSHDSDASLFMGSAREKEPGMTIKLIAMDLDGTLLDSQGRLPEANARAIAEAAARGIEIVVVTGRRFPSAQKIASELKCDVHLIASNGAVIKSSSGRDALSPAVARCDRAAGARSRHRSTGRPRRDFRPASLPAGDLRARRLGQSVHRPLPALSRAGRRNRASYGMPRWRRSRGDAFPRRVQRACAAQ